MLFRPDTLPGSQNGNARRTVPLFVKNSTSSLAHIIMTSGSVFLGLWNPAPTRSTSASSGTLSERTQLDSYTRLPISEERLRDCLGEKIYTSLAAKQVLECECGAGRSTEILLARGAFVTAVDLSDAVEAARENCGNAGLPCRFAQADISQLPFLPREFDLVSV